MDSAIFHELSIEDLENLIRDAKSVLKDKKESLIKSEEKKYQAIYKSYIGKCFKLVDTSNPNYFLCFCILELDSTERDYADKFDPIYKTRELVMNGEGFAIDFDFVYLSSLLEKGSECHYVEITNEDYTNVVNSAFDKAKERESTISTLNE